MILVFTAAIARNYDQTFILEDPVAHATNRPGEEGRTGVGRSVQETRCGITTPFAVSCADLSPPARTGWYGPLGDECERDLTRFPDLSDSASPLEIPSNYYERRYEKHQRA